MFLIRDDSQELIKEDSTNCQKIGNSVCNPNQMCVYKVETKGCNNECPFCIDKQQNSLKSENGTTVSNLDENEGTQRTVLIAGITSVLVIIGLIGLIMISFTYFKRKQKKDDFNSKLEPTKPSIQSPTLPLANVLLPSLSETLTLSSHEWQKTIDYLDYDHPHSPFIIGAQSLQIPHLDSHHPSTTLNRGSLHIQSTPFEDFSSLCRASSVRVTKYDHRCLDLKASIDPLRQIVKKNTHSNSSSMTRVASVCSDKAWIIPIHTEDQDQIDIYFYPLPDDRELTIQPSVSTSTLGDGEITVYLEI